MYIEQSDLLGTAYIGVFAATNDKITFLPHNSEDEFITLVEDVLKTEAVKVSVASSPLMGVMTAMNSHCIALPRTAYTDEICVFKEYLDTLVLEKFTAVGNMITANDNGVAASPLITKKEKDWIASSFDAKVESVSVAGLDTTGACVVATQKGFLANPNTTKDEAKRLEKLFKVKGEIGSLNYGNPFVKGSMIANSHGAIVGTTSTPFELGRVDDALFFKK